MKVLGPKIAEFLDVAVGGTYGDHQIVLAVIEGRRWVF